MNKQHIIQVVDQLMKKNQELNYQPKIIDSQYKTIMNKQRLLMNEQNEKLSNVSSYNRMDLETL